MDDTTSSYDSESTRLYLGPVQTPEREFLANRYLFAPQVPHSPRRSPRLSSPQSHPPSTSSLDEDNAVQEAKDIDLVTKFVNEVEDEDDEAMPYTLFGTPQRVEESEQDEPLSALADKILHAVDNPSPPPSPATALKMFDPYHPANVSDSDEYEGDLLFSHVNQGPTTHDSYPLIKLPESSDASTSQPAVNQDLIVFDSPSEWSPFNHTELPNVSQPMSVDDLLANSPLHAFLNHEPTPLIDESKSGGDLADSLNMSPREGQLAFHRSPEMQERHLAPFSVPLLQPTFSENATPLRRSSRPRKSVAPTPSPQPPAVVTVLPSVRAFIRKKDVPPILDGGNGNPQDDRDEGRKSPARGLPSTPRSRHRSPNKEPFSFHREVGSLSPASASMLSSLAFNSIDVPGPTIRTAVEPQAALSFSVLVPSGEVSDAVSTPVRNDGPKRVPNSPRVELSPQKFRLQLPAPNDPTNTPARRIPIDQAFAAGQLSPEKVAKLGLTENNATSVIKTPARRILISENHATIPKPTTPTLESSEKQLLTQESSAPRHAIPSVKGKEKGGWPPSQGASSSVIKQGALPFPIVATTSAFIQSQASVTVHNLPKPGYSPARSALKINSKIPRINKKPYARKVLEKSTKSTTTRQTDSGKSHYTSMNSSTTMKKPVRPVETSNMPNNPVSCPTLTVSTSTNLVKRKRQENSSPSKPQVRQVSPLTILQLSATSTMQTTDKGLSTDQQIHETIRDLRVATPPPEPDVPHENSTTVELRLQSEDPGPSSLLEGNDLPPDSPMKQDPLEVQPPKPTDNFPSAIAESRTLGLRRTTRPRRPVHSSNETVPRKTTRRKASSQQFDDVFSGMSITALKELTMTNTEKNQHYVAAKLETEVVRKEGLRPESPVVKIRTIVQRQQEEKEYERAERAKRRARRSGNDSTSDIEASSDVGHPSPNQMEDVDMDTNFDVDGPKHRRGAGDDDDYETPERPLRDVRAGLSDDGSGNEQLDRRVKWDRGLFTLAYLDEVKLGSRQNLKENITLKGILAPTAKALRLDTLGNLLHADTPLTDLVPENVTVKKFVYDNDAPSVEPPAPKTTRSKSKRK